MATATFGMLAVLPSFAQSDLGVKCGCPPVASRDSIILSGDLSPASLNLTCAHNYILDGRVFVTAGNTLQIEPGTVIKGRPGTSPATESALIVSRDARINAAGTADCPIVFTSNSDKLDGTYPINNSGKWGGLVILGRASNNLTGVSGPAGPGKLALQEGLGVIEGFNVFTQPAALKYAFGADITHGESFNDNDNSGILTYVSIRHSGAVLEVGNEINGLTLGSVGRGTTIHHIEVLSCADDSYEFFGGTVNIKYAASIFSEDDMFDWDLGYSGKLQFLFGLKNTATTATPGSDNGFEADTDDNNNRLGTAPNFSTGAARPASKPIIYNATLIGSIKDPGSPAPDNSGIAAINLKEDSRGEIYHSVFTNWARGVELANEAAPNQPDSYQEYNAGAGALKIQCNTFASYSKDITSNLALEGSTATRTALTGNNKFLSGAIGASAGALIPGLTTPFANGSPVVDATPDAGSAVETTTAGCVPPTDGFFTPANYRGAFNPAGPNWLKTWSYTSFKGLNGASKSCATDVNQDGTTGIPDLNQVLLELNKPCSK